MPLIDFWVSQLFFMSSALELPIPGTALSLRGSFSIILNISLA